MRLGKEQQYSLYRNQGFAIKLSSLISNGGLLNYCPPDTGCSPELRVGKMSALKWEV